MSRPLAFLLLFAAVLPTSSKGQDPLERLQSAVDENPADHSARCRLAFALVRAGRFAPARDAATPAIDALRGESGRAARRLLGVCLYNRGRAQEGLGELALAKADYVSSLASRTNDTVLARLTSLLPRDSEELPSALRSSPHAALAVAASGMSAADDRIFAELAQSGAASWTLVTVGPGGYQNGSAFAYAVAEVCGGLQAIEVDSVSYDNATHLHLRENSPLRFGRTDALVVHLEGGGDDNCRTMDGMMDYTHRATSVVFVDDCRLRVAVFETIRGDCDGEGTLSVRFEPSGHAIVSNVTGDATHRAGRYSLRQIARPLR